ncbi:hypothetical protein GQ597_06225 [Gilliamella sp. Pra-s65]|uniref:hypothetical protein n=1 Tax=unclassified Gilliamella TaxID=2685620 RepID=UPI001365CAC0|nr:MULTISPECIES: hypothetical protein [unclassified Gilliamella]MWN90295.1 hypothetical protein [Gilliamella sp. Pra-s65]MWP73248.1 hypothetical protein [Gilliamella sp. Pra-s52]
MNSIVIENKKKPITLKILWALGAIFLVLVVSGGYYFFKNNTFVTSQPVSQQPKNIKIKYVTPKFFGYYQHPIVFNCINSIEYDEKLIEVQKIDNISHSKEELQKIRENCIPF